MTILNFLYWDPSRAVFNYPLPILDRPILWYGFFFAVGFFLGYLVLLYLLARIFINKPEFSKEDIVQQEKLLLAIKEKGFTSLHSTAEKRCIEKKLLEDKKTILVNMLNEELLKEPFFEKQDRFIPQSFTYYVDRCPKKEREAFKARITFDHLFSSALKPFKEKVKRFADKILICILIGAVLGARLGDVIFYQGISVLLKDPLYIFKIWEGGLASHGAAIGIVISLYVLSLQIKREKFSFGFLELLDLVVIPAPLVGCFIRIGNFFNQEILGKVTTIPWAIIFGHPIDGSAPLPRHPVQLYEAVFYLALFFFLFFYWKKLFPVRSKGKIFGLCLSLLFTFRFVIEYWKMEQSDLLSSSFLTMGQFLSLPFILLGLFYYFRKK